MARAKPASRKSPAVPKSTMKASVKKASGKKDEVATRGRLTRTAKTKAQAAMDSYVESDPSDEAYEKDDDGEDDVDMEVPDTSAVEEIKATRTPDGPEFKPWKTGTKLASGSALTEVSQVCTSHHRESTKHGC